MTFTVTVRAPGQYYTAYEGVSQAKAAQAVDFARAVLLMSGGSAGIFVGQKNHGSRLAWNVIDGTAAMGPGATWISWRAEQDGRYTPAGPVTPTEPELGNPQGLEIRQGGRLTQYVPPPKGE